MMTQRLTARIILLVLVTLTIAILLPTPQTNSSATDTSVNLTLRGNLAGNFKAIFVQGNYAYAGEGAMLSIVDISDPSQPKRVGSVNVPDIIDNIYVVGEYAYVAANTAGLRIISVSDVTNPNEVGFYDTPGWAWGVYVAGNYAYLTDGVLRIISITNPRHPVEVGVYDSPGYAETVFVSGAYAYIPDGYSGLRIVSVSDPVHPTEVGFLDTPGYTEDVVVSGFYAYVADGSSGLRIISIADPTRPVEVGSYDTPGWAETLQIYGIFAYLADEQEGVTSSGLRVISIKDPFVPQQVAYYQTPGTAKDVYVIRSTGYVADLSGGLLLLSVTASLDVPHFFQKIPPPHDVNPPWEDDPYGRYPMTDTVNTVGKWGCYMTSAAMIINYWGQRSQDPFGTDPGDFNYWLRGHNGYDKDHGVVHSKIISYSHENNVLLYNPSYIPGRDNAKLDDYLSSGNPVIIGVNPTIDSTTGRLKANHFVVATGKTMVNDRETYVINDPIYGRTTLQAQWDDNYWSILFLSNTESDQRTIRISAHSPVELLVTDPQGRKSGYDPVSGTFWDEIPEAEYFDNSIGADGGVSETLESKILMIYAPTEGDYEVKVLGVSQGTYEIDIFASNSQGQISQRTLTGTAQFGSADDLTLHYSSYTGVLNSIYLPLVRK